MKHAISTLILISVFSTLLNGQLSVREKRDMDRFYNAGVEQLRENDYIEAITSFDECLGIDSTHAKAYMNRGRVKAALGDHEGAINDLGQAIRFDQDLGEAFFYKGYFLYGKDTTSLPVELLKASISKGFEMPQAHYLIGLEYLESGEDDKALISFNKAIRQKDDFALAYHERAGIKRKMGDFNGALYDYKSAVNYREDFPVAFNNMGSVKIVLGDFEGAIQDFSTAIEQSSDLHLAYNNRGYANYQLGNLDTALEDFRKAITLQPAFMEAKLNTASVLTKLDQLDESLAMLDQVIQENPEEGELYLNRGLVKEMKGEVIEACNDWNKALELGEEQATEYLKECK